MPRHDMNLRQRRATAGGPRRAGRQPRALPGALAFVLALAGAPGAATVSAQPGADSAAAPVTPPPTSSTADTTRPVLFLEELVVTGARYPRAYYESPQALSFLSRHDLRERAPSVLGDALGQLPGVDMSKDSPWEQRPVLRGLGGQRVLVLMDGTPINSARGNGPHPSLVDPAQVERVEVVRGPSSVAYGSDALGGAINIITRDPRLPEGERFHGAATLGGSSADRQRNGYVELTPRIGRLTAFLSGGGRRALDFETPTEGRIFHSSFRDVHGLANLRLALTPHLALRGGVQLYRGRDIWLPGLTALVRDGAGEPVFFQEFSFPHYDRDAARLSLEHDYPDAWLAKTQATLYWQRERRNFFSHQEAAPPFASPPPGVAGARVQITNQDRFLDLRTWGFQTQFTTRRTPRTLLSAGLDLARDRTDGDNVRHRYWVDAYGTTVFTDPDQVTTSVPDGTFDSYAAFAQGEWYPVRRWTVNVGGRYTRYRYRIWIPTSIATVIFPPTAVDDGAFSGSLGLVFAPLPDLRLTANVASGYRQPNAQDLFFNGPASVGIVQGNPELQPERSVSWDLGVRWGPGPVALAGNLFHSTYDDLIDAIQVAPPPAPGAPATYRYVNITRARIQGGELQVDARFLRDFQARATVAGAVGDITNAEAILRLYGVQQDRAPLPQVPPLKGTAAVRWRHPGGRFWLEPSVRWSWRTDRLPLPTPGVPFFTEFKKEWLVGDITAGAQLPAGQRIVVGVRNVADRVYRQPIGTLDEPGRSWIGSLTVDF